MEEITFILDKLKNFNIHTFITLLAAILIFLLFKLCSELFSYIIIKIFKIKEKNKEIIKRNPFFKPLIAFFNFTGLFIAIIFLHPPVNMSLFITKMYRCIIIFLISVGLANCVNLNSTFIKKIKKDLNLENQTSITSLFSKIIKCLIYSIAIVIIISELGYDINGLIAGLGIGGLTVALAAQDTAKNLFGGFTIIFDKPFVIGDWISTPSIEGTVEDITLRSTRIRTFKDSLISIPNSTISNESITNWSKMARRRIDFNLTIKFDTPLKKLCDTINDIEKMLNDHPNVCKEKIYVHFINIGDSGMDIQIYFFTTLKNYSDYLDVKENINYKIMKIIELNKVQLAYPTSEIILTK